jgi:hypothetical protein
MSLSLKGAALLLAAAALTGCGGESGVAGGPTPATTPVAVNSSNPTAQGVTAPGAPTDAATPAAATPPVVAAPMPAAPSPTTGTATLDWLPPTQTTDGSVLTDLAGYFVYYGTDATHLNQRVQLRNPGLTAYVIDGLPQGSYVFAVSAYNSAGIESTLSNIASKTVL